MPILGWDVCLDIVDLLGFTGKTPYGKMPQRAIPGAISAAWPAFVCLLRPLRSMYTCSDPEPQAIAIKSKILLLNSRISLPMEFLGYLLGSSTICLATFLAFFL